MSFIYLGNFPHVGRMDLNKLNEVAQEHNLPERRSIEKSKKALQEVKSELNSVSGKKGPETYKRKREEIENRDFNWPSPSQSPSQSQSQGENKFHRSRIVRSVL